MITWRVERENSRSGARRASWWWPVGWLLAAGWAAAFPLVSDVGTHRVWGVCAAFGYTAAAVASRVLPGPRAVRVPVVLALAGAVVLPLLLLVLTGQAQSEVDVIERSGRLLYATGTPYLDAPRRVEEYTPYLPGMALLGIPRALLGEHGWAARYFGDARVWCAAVFLACLVASRAVVRQRGQRRRPGGGVRSHVGSHVPDGDARFAAVTAVLIASPVVALPLCVSGVDLPLAGLCVLAIAFAVHGRPVAAGLVLAAACSLKWTAWPALPVVVALLGRAWGARPALRCAGTAIAGTALLILPSALLSPGQMVEQVLAFPTGRGELATPATSPLPGRLLAEQGATGWAVAVTLLLCGASAVGLSLVLRPPRDAVGAADRLAIGLSVAFLLAPAGRFGYLALPVLLVVWARSVGAGSVGARWSGTGSADARWPGTRSVGAPSSGTGTAPPDRDADAQLATAGAGRRS
ncbi:glycosyltransferase 87 family protein [Streptomyces niveus]|uniref:glycosyltransferase 87 family protein n=1 Tax=Streptomyces niveus TaxID=193462 RepID=UPI001FE1A446|nr:glycosyltransferase 87 family protein [Streptomyces niveus]